jgi:septum formation protein
LKLPYPLILASTSKYRAQLLAQLGWEFSGVAPAVDEDAQKKIISDPRKLCETLSLMKAQDVFKKNSESLIIGSDQVCTLKGKIYGKPHDFERAHRQLSDLQGQTHELMTGVSIVYPKGTVSFVNTTKLTMRPLSSLEIDLYLQEDQPYDCAGSYKLETRGIKLFSAIEMSDHTSIIGLPLINLSNELIKLGYPI